MEPERWQRVEQLYHAALELAENERASFLENSCSNDHSLRHGKSGAGDGPRARAAR